jgi:hypothetical protein
MIHHKIRHENKDEDGDKWEQKKRKETMILKSIKMIFVYVHCMFSSSMIPYKNSHWSAVFEDFCSRHHFLLVAY